MLNYIYNYELLSSKFQLDNDELSIVVNFKEITKAKHLFFNEIMKILNTNRKYYFVKAVGKNLNENLINLVEKSSIKIIQSNFPDTIFLPLIISLYGVTVPKYVLFIEGEDLLFNNVNKLIKWFIDSYIKIEKNKLDYIFGGFQVIDNKKIGCSLLLSKSSVIEHLLYYTNSDTSHSHPFIQLSLATKTKFFFENYPYLNSSKIDNINQSLSLNMNCPKTNDIKEPSLCIILPNFKRNYLFYSFSAFSKQTFKPKYYVLIQNENRIHYNISLIQKIVKEPIYHIWMQNWNSYFYLNLRLTSVFPCDFVLKYDDDQWPNEKTIQEKLINRVKNKNKIIGFRGYKVKTPLCGYSPTNFTIEKPNIVDHSAVPIIFRPGYIKLDARNNIFRLYGGEDISLSLNSRKLCNVISETMKMKLIEHQKDGNNQRKDKSIILAYEQENQKKFDLFENIYCYLIRSGYIPRKWSNFRLPLKDFLNITIEHKTLN